MSRKKWKRRQQQQQQQQERPLNYRSSYQKPPEPRLVFGPAAWLKLQYLCHKGNTEIGGYGVALDPEQPLLIHDLVVPKQTCTVATVEFDMDDLADRWEVLLARGLQPYQYSSVWIHTHPGDSASPSWTDEGTFAQRSGPWSVMFILARGGATSCRLKVRSEGGLLAAEKELAVAVDWTQYAEESPLGQLAREWADAYQECVTSPKYTFVSHPNAQRSLGFHPSTYQPAVEVAAVQEHNNLHEAYEEYYHQREVRLAAEERELRELFPDYESK